MSAAMYTKSKPALRYIPTYNEEKNPVRFIILIHSSLKIKRYRKKKKK